MKTTRFLFLFLTLATLLWACQKEKQPVITKLPDVQVQDSIQHLTLVDSVCGKYLVSGLYRCDQSYLDGYKIQNYTLVISKLNDSSIAYSTSDSIWPQLSFNGCIKQPKHGGGYLFAAEGDYYNVSIDFPSPSLESVNLSYSQSSCGGATVYTISGTKIH